MIFYRKDAVTSMLGVFRGDCLGVSLFSGLLDFSLDLYIVEDLWTTLCGLILIARTVSKEIIQISFG